MNKYLRITQVVDLSLKYQFNDVWFTWANFFDADTDGQYWSILNNSGIWNLGRLDERQMTIRLLMLGYIR